jgi:hypothetical protein
VLLYVLFPSFQSRELQPVFCNCRVLQSIFRLSWVMYSVFISVFCTCFLKQRGPKCVPILVRYFQFCVHTQLWSRTIWFKSSDDRWIFAVLHVETVTLIHQTRENLSATVNNTVHSTALATTYRKLIII